jgi:hypothetical protein
MLNALERHLRARRIEGGSEAELARLHREQGEAILAGAARVDLRYAQARLDAMLDDDMALAAPVLPRQAIDAPSQRAA